MDLPKRKPTRLKSYDYSTPGTYFITICTKNRRPFFSSIVRQQNHLTPYGNIVQKQICALPAKFSTIKIDHFVVMPNHIHLLISNYEQAEVFPRPSISAVVCALKSNATRLCRQMGFTEKTLFQTSFHDHIVRGEDDYKKIWQYIDGNVLCWEKDCFFEEF